MRSHKHVTCLSDVAQMFYDLCMDAKKVYQEAVVNQKMEEAFFIKFFISSREYIDCDCAYCKNAYHTNLVAIQELFENRLDLIKKYLLAESFSYEDCLQLISELSIHNSSTPSSPAIGKLDHHLSDEQMACVAECADEHNLFDRAPTLKDIKAFFDCQIGATLRVNKLRLVAYLLGQLEQKGLLDYGWQKVIAGRKMLLSKKGIPVTATGLSTALSAANLQSKSVYVNIKEVVSNLAKMQAKE